jgi:crotonobetainyl-CoA:carnitine CoA-transferase CaiB-like acyl-CoA transferase
MVRFSATPIVYRRAAPLLGVDGPEVLGELGYSAERIAALIGQGVVGRGA